VTICSLKAEEAKKKQGGFSILNGFFENGGFYVITGGPGAGKTTLINALSALGHKTVSEDARKIIQHQTQCGGEGLPWKDRELYTRLMLEASLRSYREVYGAGNAGPVFFDRGLPDTLCYAKMIGMDISAEMISCACAYRYSRNVFLLPAWEEIYETDGERKQDWKEAVYTCEMMGMTYLEYGYAIIEVPKIPADKRALFVLDNL
jgi:predicted ATPase